MNKPHKHADLIKAWADGAEVEYLDAGSASFWRSVTSPRWDGQGEYRIKPEPKPDVVKYGEIGVIYAPAWHAEPNKRSNIRLIFDSETGKLKVAEVL